MCGGVEYNHQGRDFKIYFPNPYAKLPVQKKTGDVELVSWGRREGQAGNLPKGGWARKESIDKGVWRNWQPKPVKIRVHRFMEKDNQKSSHWFDLDEHHFIQGLLARCNQEQRVYVVTEIPPEGLRQIHDRWPRILMQL